MSISIDLPFGLSDLDKVFQVTEFLDNQDMLIREFRPEVSKLLVKKGFFKGPFKRHYENAFEELVVKLIRSQLVKHFPQFTPEEIVLLTGQHEDGARRAAGGLAGGQRPLLRHAPLRPRQRRVRAAHARAGRSCACIGQRP